jgi:hypothetical protein
MTATAGSETEDRTVRRPFHGRIPLYLAGALLIPQEGSEESIAGSIIHSLRK